MILKIGALMGLFSVGFGAYVDHGLRAHISTAQYESVMTALRFNQLYAVLICALGLFLLKAPAFVGRKGVVASTVLFIAGTLIFCTSIYGAAVLSIDGLTKFAPFGGMTLMAAWVCLFVSAFFFKDVSSSR